MHSGHRGPSARRLPPPFRHSLAMMTRLIAPTVRFFERWMPDAFAVAVALSFLTFLLVLTLTDMGPRAAAETWGDGLWNLLAFTNQIVLTLLLGYAVAGTAPVHRILLRAAHLVHSARSAYVVICALTCILAMLSWSLALVGAGILSRVIGQSCKARSIRVHYPLLVASAFSGFVLWHQGLTGSVGLTVATPGHFLEAQIGLIPTSQTIFSLWNLATALAVLVTLPLVMSWMHPKSDDEIEEMPDAASAVPDTTDAAPPQALTPAQRFEQSRLLCLALVLLLATFLLIHYIGRGGGLTLNTMNLALFTVGLACAGTLQRYTAVLMTGGHIAVPFLLQYPLYAGIAALIATSGLGAVLVQLCTTVATADTLPLFGLLSAGLLNILIPSGGAQWAVQGPVMMAAAQQLGADLPRVAMSVALGDQWTNLMQPLILLPVVTLAGVSVRVVMGYLFVAMIWTGIVFALALMPI